MRSAGALLLLQLVLQSASAFSATAPQSQLRGQGYLAGAGATPRAPLRVHVARLAEESDAAKSPDASLEAGFNRALTGSYALVAANGLRFLVAATGGTARSQLSVAQTAQVFVVAALALKVMKSAASRDRLNGTTFKVLSLGLLGAFGVIFCSTVYQASKLALELGTFASSTFFGFGIALLVIYTAYSAIGASYGALVEHGMPKFKMAVKSAGAKPLSILAFGYLLITLHSVWWGSVLALYSPFKIVGALRCFVVAGCAHVCQTAAVAGEKRLSSETYTTLNLALILDSAARLVTVSLLPVSQPLWVLPTIALATSTAAYVVGKTYKGN